MSIILFRITTGTKVEEFESELSARIAMSDYNAMYGHIGNPTTHFENGIEMQSYRNIEAPYGITEFVRWDAKFNKAQSLNNKYHNNDFSR